MHSSFKLQVLQFDLKHGALQTPISRVVPSLHLVHFAYVHSKQFEYYEEQVLH